MITHSWFICNKRTKAVIFETWRAEIVALLNTDKYVAIPSHEYLAGISAKEKAKSCA